MDYDFKSSPIVKRAIRKLYIVLFVLMLIEVACWFGISWLITGYYAFWLMAGLMFLGYMGGNVFAPSSKEKYTLMNSGRKFVCTMLMLPSWLTKIVALVAVVPALRRGIIALVIRFFLPKELSNIFSSALPFGLSGLGQGGGSPFEELLKSQMGAQNSSDRKTSGRSTSRYYDDGFKGETIDVESFGDGTDKEEVKVEVNRDRSRSKKKQKALVDDDVIDVPCEWEK